MSSAPGGTSGPGSGVASISAFFPCYNDEHTIGRMVETVHGVLDRLGVDYDVTVVDDGSTDGSSAVLRELQGRHPRLSVVEHGTNRGYGGALKSGFGAATHQWVFYTDGDGQYDPSELELLAKLARADVDVVQGFKLRRSDPLRRKIVGRTYHHVVAFFFGLRLRDVDCDFRLIRRSALVGLTLENQSGVICVELMRKLQVAGARIVETPVQHYPRLHGRSQFFRPRRVLRSLYDLGLLWLRVVVWPALTGTGRPRT